MTKREPRGSVAEVKAPRPTLLRQPPPASQVAALRTSLPSPRRATHLRRAAPESHLTSARQCRADSHLRKPSVYRSLRALQTRRLWPPLPPASQAAAHLVPGDRPAPPSSAPCPLGTGLTKGGGRLRLWGAEAGEGGAAKSREETRRGGGRWDRLGSSPSTHLARRTRRRLRLRAPPCSTAPRVQASSRAAVGTLVLAGQALRRAAGRGQLEGSERCRLDGERMWGRFVAGCSTRWWRKELPVGLNSFKLLGEQCVQC